ncbi:MAG: hypothetical protein KDE34_12870 [Anaerolineales bacterium]|nr:hypothetical protein [Anaerolineales bacterium]
MKREPEQIDDVLARLEVLAPRAEEAPTPAAVALAQLQTRPLKQPRWVAGWRWLTRPTGGRRFGFALALLLLLMFTFSFPAVRTAASEFLGTFRVQRFAPIAISPEQIAALSELAEQGFVPGKIEQISPGSAIAADDAAEAAELVGMTLQFPAALPAPADFQVTEAPDMRLTIDLVGARALLAAAGLDPLILPDAVDGQAVEVVTSPGVTASWPDGVVLFQTTSPQVTYPPGVDLQVMGEAALQFLGMSAAEAANLAATIDWTSTFVLPIPTGVATYEEVVVAGGPGLLISSLDGQMSGLVWQKNGNVYVLSSSDQAESDLLAIADSMR